MALRLRDVPASGWCAARRGIRSYNYMLFKTNERTDCQNNIKHLKQTTIKLEHFPETIKQKPIND